MASYWKHEQLHHGPSRRQSRIQARRVYQQVTENARDAEGSLICSICGLPGKDDEMVRDHIQLRSQGGKTTAENVRLAHVTCHVERHLSPRMPGQPS